MFRCGYNGLGGYIKFFVLLRLIKIVLRKVVRFYGILKFIKFVKFMRVVDFFFFVMDLNLNF